MKNIRNPFYLALLLLTLNVINTPISIAQQRPAGAGAYGERPAIGIIKGRLLDESTGNPIEYGSVAVISLRDSTIAGGSISDSKGIFKIDKIKTGRYFIRIQFIGYDTKVIRDIMIRPDNPEIDLGIIKLQNHVSSLSGVEITADKEMMVNNLDKKVINVDKSIASIGGSAVEVMQNIPSVTVDVDGNVSLRGSSNVTILVDGKPSGLTDLSSSDLLSQIPASSIESVEVITNPSVRYDPEGTSGIINIVLKKKSLQGLNGFISATAGTGDRYNGSVNVNFRKNKLNFFAGYDNRTGRFKSSGESTRITTYTDLNSSLNQTQSMQNKRNSNNLNAGFDYMPDNFNTLTFSFRYRNMSFGNDGDIFSKSFNPDGELVRDFIRSTNSDRGMKSFSYNASYRKTFRTKGRELTADLMLSDNSMHGSQNIVQQEYSNGMSQPDPALQYSGSDNTNTMFMIQANYTTPFRKKDRIETGFKSTVKDLSMRNNLKDFDYVVEEWLLNPLANNYFDYLEQIHALYAIYSSSTGKFKYQVGLRGEQLISDSKLALTNEKIDRSYFSLYPSVHIEFEQSEASQVLVSYSRRVSRPSHRQLNPFVDYSDSLNIRYGNPKLDPEFINSFELGWLRYWGKNSVNATTFFRNTTGIIDRIVTLQANGATATTYENLTSGTSYGLELIGSREFTPWFKSNANVSFFRNIINGSEVAGLSKVDGYMWTAKINFTFNLRKNASVQLAGNYTSPEIEAQSRNEQVFFADAAFRYDFLKGKASVNVRISDIFNSRKFDSETSGAGFVITSTRKMETRVGYIGFTYRINNYNRQKEKERNNNQNDQDIEDFQ